ncbi:LLM class flavin-dependent oxidoreductase [Amycolatopsis azurea]|uniref:Luciferase family oxidoreductase n=1 Tax=Amycolatopsis azurea DSM 43854 TaxID=1238180 RepID=M2PXB8_9PSEU|nr:LLM class flavin-dependent oxidoreductase [Amycolatopsis azurea]EMD29278.1 putative LuxAB-like Oxygenase [Amycolatopsis azurea DSM 43854]OOC01888.1 luciferase family oxidoreductase [Amycolatopsis azurea DSM 43854]
MATTGPAIPLSVLDLVPISSGSDTAEALRNTVELARAAERFGYHRYWFAEHHLNPGVAGASPPVLIALVAGATTRIRLGSAGVQLAHRTPLAVVEEFGLIDALHPGRLDLGLGRSGKQLVREYAETAGSAPPAQPANGLLIPDRPDFSGLARSARIGLTFGLLQQPGAESPDYSEQVGDILSLLGGTYRSAEGLEAHAVPGEGSSLEIWVLGSSGGQSAAVAGRNSLRFAANYHVSPSGVLEAVEAYRRAFRPSAALPRPYVAVSADAVVAEDDATARELASGYGLWVRSIRRAEGAIRFPTSEEAAAHQWSDEDRALVADRVDTQFVGSPATVAAGLRQLRDATGADELVVTTVTHDHADRVRSYELLAEHWR